MLFNTCAFPSSFLIAFWREDISAYKNLALEIDNLTVLTPSTQVFTACKSQNIPVIFAHDNDNIRPSNNGFHTSSLKLAEKLSSDLAARAREIGQIPYQRNWIHYILECSFRFSNLQYLRYLERLLRPHVPPGSTIYIKSSDFPSFLANDPCELKNYISKRFSYTNRVIIYNHQPVAAQFSWRNVSPLDFSNLPESDRLIIFASGPVQKPDHVDWGKVHFTQGESIVSLESITYANTLNLGLNIPIKETSFGSLQSRYKEFGTELAETLKHEYSVMEQIELSEVSVEFYRNYFAIQLLNFENLENLFRSREIGAVITGDICTGLNGMLHTLCARSSVKFFILPHDTVHVIARNHKLFPAAEFLGPYPDFFYCDEYNNSDNFGINQQTLPKFSNHSKRMFTDGSVDIRPPSSMVNVEHRSGYLGFNILRNRLHQAKEAKRGFSALILLNDYDCLGLCPGYSLFSFCHSLVILIRALRKSGFRVDVRPKPSIPSSREIFLSFCTVFGLIENVDFFFTTNEPIEILYESKNYDIYYSHFGPSGSLSHVSLRQKPPNTLFCGYFFDIDDPTFDDCALWDISQNIVYFKPEMLFWLG